MPVKFRQTPKHFLSHMNIQVTLEKLRSLVSRYAPRSRGAFYVMSPQRVTRMIDLWNGKLPSVRPFYAVKCNPDPHILHHLYDAGLGFDCASKRELLSIKDLARSSNALAEDIVYANPCKSEHDISAAEEMGSPPTVVDSVEEVDKLAEYGGGIYIRIAVDDKNSSMPFSSKFGAATDLVPHIGRAAKAYNMRIHGISFHVGSSCFHGRPYRDAIQTAYACIRKLREDPKGTLVASPTIDIGGGYVPHSGIFNSKAIFIQDAIMNVNKAELEQDKPPIRFIAEPGRFFATKSYDFFVQVIGKKDGLYGWNYTIDDSVYGQFSSVLFDQAKPTWIRVQGIVNRPRKYGKGVLFGRTCDSVDVIARAEYMEELEVGDWLWFPNMGAYTHATASDFNGFPKPEIFVDNEAAEVRHRSLNAFSAKGLRYIEPVRATDFWSTISFGGKIDPPV